MDGRRAESLYPLSDPVLPSLRLAVLISTTRLPAAFSRLTLVCFPAATKKMYLGPFILAILLTTALAVPLQRLRIPDADERPQARLARRATGDVLDFPEGDDIPPSLRGLSDKDLGCLYGFSFGWCMKACLDKVCVLDFSSLPPPPFGFSLRQGRESACRRLS